MKHKRLSFEYLVFLIFITTVFLFSCKKDDNSVPSQKYTDAKGTYLILTSETWSCDKYTEGGGEVRLTIAGSTNGNSAEIETFGDGNLSYSNINLNAQNNFDQNYQISFTSYPVSAGVFHSGTTIYVFRGADTLKVNLTSGDLNYN